MRNKYFILAITFLNMLVGQQIYGQDYDEGTDYSTIDNIVDGLLRLNPDIEVEEYSYYEEYVYDINNDGNTSNDFVDTNGDGLVNISDNLYKQNLANTLGFPRTTSEADLEAALLAALSKTVQLYEVIVYSNKKNLENGTSGFTIYSNYNGPTVDSDGNPIYYEADVHYNSLAEYLMVNSSGGSGSNTTSSNSTTQSSTVSNKLTAMLQAAGIYNIAVNPVTRTVVVARALASYGIIITTSDSSCNNTPGGCQSWLNSNYIGATSSNDNATKQRYEKGVEPIDAVDLAAFHHDVAYDNLGAAGASSALFDLNTLQADKDLLAACYNVLDMYSNEDIDPRTGVAVSLATKERALLVIEAFQIIVTEKELRN